jgi:hypothetical protein
MTKKEAEQLLAEFEQKHTEYSIERGGRPWASNGIEDAKVEDGRWIYKGHDIAELHRQLEKLNK